MVKFTLKIETRWIFYNYWGLQITCGSGFYLFCGVILELCAPLSNATGILTATRCSVCHFCWIVQLNPLFQVEINIKFQAFYLGVLSHRMHQWDVQNFFTGWFEFLASDWTQIMYILLFMGIWTKTNKYLYTDHSRVFEKGCKLIQASRRTRFRTCQVQPARWGSRVTSTCVVDLTLASVYKD